MKGLFMKDFLILKNQGKTMLIVFAMGIMMSLTFEPATLVFYVGMLGCLLALSTISYDEADNGYAFLFSLPIKRKSYVLEKYLFIFVSTLVFLAISLLISIIMSLTGVHDMKTLIEGLPSMLLVLFITLTIVCDVSIPLRLKFGSEKSRIYLYLFYALAGVLVFVGQKLFPSLGVTVVNRIAATPAAFIVGIVAVFVIVATIVSEKISEKIIMAKQF